MEPDQSPDPAPQDALPILPYYTHIPSDVRLVTIQRIGAIEAQLAAAKLQSEGIRCFIADLNIAGMHPALINSVRLQVAESDVQQAEEILTRPADVQMEGEYADEDWRCPACHRKAVDLLPLSPGWRRARVGCLSLLALPLILFAIQKLIPDPQSSKQFQQASESWWPLWLLVVMVLSLLILFVKRRKRCRECGHEWEK